MFPHVLLIAALFAEDTPAQPRPLAEPRQEEKPNLSPETRGDIFMARKMYREAIETYKEGPTSAVLFNKTGIGYHQLMQLPQAKKYYEQATRANPKYSEALNNIGTVHYARKSYRRAIAYYKKALDLTPNSASIHSNLGTAYFARKNYKDAFEEYQIAINLDPEVFEHRSSQGVLLQERTVTERAKFHYYLAKTYAKAGATEKALQYMRMAIEEGFKDRNKFREEPEFTAMREMPEFQQLLAMELRVPL